MDSASSEVDKTSRSILLSRSSQTLLNRRIRRHGDVSRLINAALAGVNLKTIKVEVREKTRGTTKADLISRTVMFEAPLLKAAQETAQQRGVSFNALVDAAVAAQFGPPQKL